MFRKKFKFFFWGIIFIFTIPASSLAGGNENLNPESVQQTRKKISGIVKDNAEVLTGVSVSVKGTDIGTTTDIEGKFTLNVPENGTLVFSYLSYVTQEVKISDRTSYDIVMVVNTKILDEVVVVGYGVQKKSDITGAMVNVREDLIRQAPVGNIASALQGLAAGVDIQMAGGNTHPAAVPQIRIRGERSINASNDVLIVVDGIPFSGSLNDISNDDIASVSVLKDASATAIYGSRAANGVMLITTKRGTGKELKVTYNGYYGTTSAINMFPMMNSEQFMRLKKWANYNSDPTKYSGVDDPAMMTIGVIFSDQDESDGYYAGVSTNWQDLVFNTGKQTNHQVAVSGGGERSTYNVSIGYYDAQNAYEINDFNRMTTKMSIDSDIKKWLKVGLSSLNTYTMIKGQDFNPMEQALQASPFGTPYNADGTLRTSLAGSRGKVWNPLLDIQEGAIVDNRKNLSTFTTGYAELIFPLGFKYRFNGGLMLRQESMGEFYAKNTTNQQGRDNRAFSESRWKGNYTLENIFTWDKTLREKHNFGVTGVFAYEEDMTDMQNISTSKYIDENIQYYNPSKAGEGTTSGNGEYKKWSLLSYMGRLNYNYDERYLLTATIRRDGSSRLAEGSKWHAFPSLALGWNIIHESFMKDLLFLSGLKLRASWGNVGNTAVNPYQTIARLSDNKYMLGNTGVMGFFPNSVPDKTLGWENTETVNIGLDFGFLRNRITGTVEWYRQSTTDLLLPVVLPRTSGYTNSYLTNIGATGNQGIELNFTTHNIDGNGKNTLQWSTDWTFFTNRNKVVNLGDGVDRITSSGLFVGEDRYVIYSLEADGLWQDTPEDRALAASFGYATEGKTSVIGNIKIKNHHVDYEADGVTPKAVQTINDDDRIFIGKRAPDFEGGINNRFAWKGFDLAFLLSYKVGGTITSDMHNSWMNQLIGEYNNINLDYWTPENTGARWPKPNQGGVSNMGLLSRYDGTYLKLRNFTLGYTIPEKILEKIDLSSVRLYLTGNNLYTWFSSEYKKDGGIDPETTSTINLTTPPVRSFMFGINVSF